MLIFNLIVQVHIIHKFEDKEHMMYTRNVTHSQGKYIYIYIHSYQFLSIILILIDKLPLHYLCWLIYFWSTISLWVQLLITYSLMSDKAQICKFLGPSLLLLRKIRAIDHADIKSHLCFWQGLFSCSLKYIYI